MYQSNYATGAHLIFYVVVALVFIVPVVWRKFSIGALIRGGSTDMDADAPDASAIISYYTAGYDLVDGAGGTLNDMRYSMLLTVPRRHDSAVRDIPFTKSGALIYTLDLPFNTETQLVGLSKKYKIDALEFETFLLANNLERIQLEGDFSDYYDLYAAKGQQFQARYVLDPEAMAFVVDYCRSNFWEINGSELYFVVAQEQGEGTNLIEESQQFVQQIKPALLPGDPNAPAVHHEASYGVYEGPPMHCPICDATLFAASTSSVQSCPTGHGVLLNAADLLKLHHGQLNIQADPSLAQTHAQLTCPNCKNPLVEVNYEESGVVINSCEHCPYRWLDANVLSELTSGKQHGPTKT